MINTKKNLFGLLILVGLTFSGVVQADADSEKQKTEDLAKAISTAATNLKGKVKTLVIKTTSQSKKWLK